MQKGIFTRMCIGLMVAIVALGIPFICPLVLPIPSVEIFFISLIIPTFAYILGIIKIATLRFFKAELMDPLAVSTNPSLRIYSQYLSNTLEQLILCIITYALLSFVLPVYNLYLILILSGLFGMGRIFFITGYKKDSTARALGFALTFYPTIVGFLVGIIFLMVTL